MSTTSIAIVDDQLLFRQGLAALIQDAKTFTLQMEAESGNELVEKLKQQACLPDILLMDMKLPDISGLELNAIIQKIVRHLLYL